MLTSTCSLLHITLAQQRKKKEEEEEEEDEEDFLFCTRTPPTCDYWAYNQ